MTFSNSILAGTILVREAIQSENFEAGSTGWQITRDGDAEFNDVTARGDILADSLNVVDPDEPNNEILIDLLVGVPFTTHRHDVSGTQVTGLAFSSNTINGGHIQARNNNNNTTLRIEGGDQGADYAGAQLNGDNITVRVGSERRESNISSITSEEVIDSISFPFRDRRDYEIMWSGHFQSNNDTNQRVGIFIREDDINGNVRGAWIDNDGGDNADHSATVRTIIPGATSGTDEVTKTVVVTMERITGTGSLTARGGGGREVVLTADETAQHNI